MVAAARLERFAKRDTDVAKRGAGTRGQPPNEHCERHERDDRAQRTAKSEVAFERFDRDEGERGECDEF